MSQSLAKIYIHLVFSTKKRENLIDEEIEKELFPYMAKVYREIDSPSLTINAAKNHVHSLFLLSKKVFISPFQGLIIQVFLSRGVAPSYGNSLLRSCFQQNLLLSST